MRIARDYVLAVAAAVDFQVRPHEIAPDLYPHPDDGCPVEIRNLTNVSMANKAIALPTETKCGASSSCGAMRSITNNS